MMFSKQKKDYKLVQGYIILFNLAGILKDVQFGKRLLLVGLLLEKQYGSTHLWVLKYSHLLTGNSSSIHLSLRV